MSVPRAEHGHRISFSADGNTSCQCSGQGNTYNTPGGTNSNQGSYHYSNSNGRCACVASCTISVLRHGRGCFSLCYSRSRCDVPKLIHHHYDFERTFPQLSSFDIRIYSYYYQVRVAISTARNSPPTCPYGSRTPNVPPQLVVGDVDDSCP